MHHQRFLKLSCTVALLTFCCVHQLVGDEPGKQQDARKLVPLPQQVPTPADNPTTAAKIELGRQLFFDPRLSGNNTMSCATCHLPDADKGFADGLARSKGADGKLLTRNTQGLLNVAFYRTLFWDGRSKSLEEQALGPITNPNEMNQPLDDLEQELSAVAGYAAAFREIYKSQVTRDGIAKSLAAFQRTLISRNSPFDRYLQGDKKALSDEAKRGLDLFVGEADCVRCHHGPLLSDGEYYRLGASLRDPGRQAVTGKEVDRHKFRTPALRDVARTAPYMHNGSMRSLQDVVLFYLRSPPASGPDSESIDITPRNGVSLNEVDDIVAFLKSLSGQPPKVTPPELP